MALTARISVMDVDPRTLLKVPQSEITVSSIRPTGEVNLLTPTFVLDYKEAYTSKNYIYVGAPFNRYYFITDMKIDIGKKIIINCKVDVLQSFSQQVLSSRGYIIRTGSYAASAKYLPDENIPINTQTQTQNYEFSSTPFQTIDSINGNYILTVIGGGPD